MSIEFDVSESTAEYLRIRIARSKDDDEVHELREQLTKVERELHKKHREAVANSRKK